MTKPGQDLLNRFDPGPLGHRGTVDHQNRQAQLAGSIQLGPRPLSAGILADDKIDPVITQQRKILCQPKGAAGDHGLGIGQGQGRARRIDQAQKVMMFWPCGKILKVLSANCQEDPAGRRGQGLQGGRLIRHMAPAIVRPGLPGRALQRDQRQVQPLAGSHGMAAHLRGEGMGRIDEMRDRFVLQVPDKACDSAKSTDTRRQGLGQGRLGPAGVGKHARNGGIGQRTGQQACFGRAPQNEDAHV